MKTAIILDIDNLQEHDLGVALSFYTRDTTFFAIGLAPADLNFTKEAKVSLGNNIHKFNKLAAHFKFTPSQLEIIPNAVTLKESSDIRIAQIAGKYVFGKFDQCIMVSNDHSMYMVAIMLKQSMPTWIMLSRPHMGIDIQITNRAVCGVPTIKVKKFPEMKLQQFARIK